MTFDFQPNQNEDRNGPVENVQQEADISARIGEAEINGVEDGHLFVAAPRKWFTTPQGRKFLQEMMKEEGATPSSDYSVTEDVMELAKVISAALIGYKIYQSNRNS